MNLYINKDNVEEARIIECLGDYWFFKLIIKFRGEKKFREVARSFEENTLNNIMEDFGLVKP